MHAPRKRSARSCAPRSPFPSPLRRPLNTCAEFSGNALKPPLPRGFARYGIPSSGCSGAGPRPPPTSRKRRTLRRRASATADRPRATQFLPKRPHSLIICTDAVDSAESGRTIKCKTNRGREAIKNISTAKTKPSPRPPRASSAGAGGPDPSERRATPGKGKANKPISDRQMRGQQYHRGERKL